MSREEMREGGFTHLYNWDYDADGTRFTWQRDGYLIEAFFSAETNSIDVTVKNPERVTIDRFSIDVSPHTTTRLRPPQTDDEITREVQEHIALRAEKW